MIYSDEKLMEKFISNIRKARTGDCLIWTGAHEGEYARPRMWNGQRPIMVRRWLMQRSLPDRELWPNEYVENICRTRLCVNLGHLVIWGPYRGRHQYYVIRNGKRELIDIEGN